MSQTLSKGSSAMTLKAPGILTFMVAIILVVAVVMIRFFGASVPLLNGHEFWGLLGAFTLLALGCLLRGL